MRDQPLRTINSAADNQRSVLDLSEGKLTQLPSEIKQLSAVTHLDLSANKLTSLPLEITKLSNLEVLNLRDNRLAGFPTEILQLPKLRSLNLSVNLITELPMEIEQLTLLFELDLSFNQLAKLPSQIGGIRNLTRLNLSGNSLKDLPVEIKDLASLQELDVRENELQIPPEILDRWREPGDIVHYYLEHRTGTKKPLNEAKMLVVGQGSVGKTSLVKRLVSDEFDLFENKTEGIDIQRWQVTVNGTPIRLNVWDFGGQEIMHATHQFFLTKRSLYLLVVNTRTSDEDNRIEYWLKIIQSFGKDSPVIVVGNKVDQQPADLDRRGLAHKYRNIKAFIETSCQTGTGIEELKVAIAKEVGSLEHIHDLLLTSWFTVKTQLEEMKEDFIPYHSYQDLCVSQGINDERSQSTLVGFLHDLGIVLNFRDDPRLLDTNILNPEWVTNAVYKILNSHVLFQAKGALELQELSAILDTSKYPKDKHLFIMDLMRKFELCFDFEGLRDQKFHIPDLLPKGEPDTGTWDDALAFQYHYNVLPNSIISRFIVRMHEYINKNTLWRSGVVLKRDKNRALIKADFEDRKIIIRIGGPNQSRRPFLESIRGHFDSIHKTIPGIVADEKVPLRISPDVAPIDYKHLLRLESMGITEWIPEGLENTVNVIALLNGIEPEETRRKRQRIRQRDRPLPLSTGERETLNILIEIKGGLDSKSNKLARLCLFAFVALSVTTGAGIALLVYWLGWNTIEPWTYFLAFGAMLAPYTYFAITLKELSPVMLYEQLLEKIRTKNYARTKFDVHKFDSLIKRTKISEVV